MRLAISAVILGSFMAQAAAADITIESFHPRIVPAEVAFLKHDVVDAVTCLRSGGGKCGFVNDELSSLGRDEIVRLASVPAHAEFTASPEAVHIIFRQSNGSASAVIVYLRTERGLERSGAVLAS
jgi:hypothetical protein